MTPQQVFGTALPLALLLGLSLGGWGAAAAGQDASRPPTEAQQVKSFCDSIKATTHPAELDGMAKAAQVKWTTARVRDGVARFLGSACNADPRDTPTTCVYSRYTCLVMFDEDLIVRKILYWDSQVGIDNFVDRKGPRVRAR